MANNEERCGGIHDQMLNMSISQSRTSSTNGKTAVIEDTRMEIEKIMMDLVIGLPRHDAVWVIVDRLTKSAHFLPIQTIYSLDKLASLYISEIVRLHGVLL